jgi:nucleoside-diphosphate-sugar epimerase
MQVFVTGATGYVGSHVAAAFRRGGHRVWGLTRSKEKARPLERQEIAPVVGDLADLRSYAAVAAQSDVLVHAAFEYSAQGVTKDKTALEALIEAARRGPPAQPRTVIFTSGVWVHGNTGANAVDETATPNPIQLVAWRTQHEQLVLTAPGIRGVVIRPGCVYGGAGGLTAPWFADATAGKAPTVVGDGKNRWAMVHADDLADAYRRAAESGLGGEIFDIADRSRATALEMATAAARAAGYGGEIRPLPLAEARNNLGDFAEALAIDQQVSSAKATRLLAWQPRHTGFLDEVEVYYRAWKAWQD